MQVAFEPQNRFFHGLNPSKHFAILRDEKGNIETDPRKRFRVSSATFKYKRIDKRKWESSVDSERVISLEGERKRTSDRFPGYGIAAVTFASISEVKAEVELKPEEGNEAHCALYATETQIDDLVKPNHLIIIDWPTGAIRA